jgi:hypothetical protein
VQIISVSLLTSYMLIERQASTISSNFLSI